MKVTPSMTEIAVLPMVGIAASELRHTRLNELYLFLLPFLIVGVRLFWAQLQRPPPNTEIEPVTYEKASRNCLAWNQMAALVLLLLESGAVIASDPTAPVAVWLVISALYCLYVMLRLLSRGNWLIAAGAPSYLQ